MGDFFYIYLWLPSVQTPFYGGEYIKINQSRVTASPNIVEAGLGQLFLCLAPHSNSGHVTWPGSGLLYLFKSRGSTVKVQGEVEVSKVVVTTESES